MEMEIEPERMFREHFIKGLNQGMENEPFSQRMDLVDALRIDMERRLRHRLEEDYQSSHQSRSLDWQTAGALYWQKQLVHRNCPPKPAARMNQRSRKFPPATCPGLRCVQ